MNHAFTPFKLLVLLLLTFPGPLSMADVPEGWSTDITIAKESAAELRRPILLMFTGSDWCGWCKRFHTEILDTDIFMDWAGDHIELVYVDFPRKDYQANETKQQNQELDEQYSVDGYPTLILIDAKGTELGRFGYMQGGPKTFIRALKRAAKR